MARRSIDRYSLFLRRGIPVIAVAGMFFFVAASRGSELAFQLFQESEWVQCHRECLRALGEMHGKSAEPLRLLDALALLNGASQSEAGQRELTRLAETASDDEVRCSAAYHSGRIAWQAGRIDDGWRLLRQAFVETEDGVLFARAGCSLALLAEAAGEDAADDAVIMMQLRTTARLWSPDVLAECRLEQDGKDDTPGPARWFVAFYRRQISPAIGSRCSMEPSCSEYFLRASQKHGVLGIPMIADRLVRESTVHAQGDSPVLRDGKVRYRDPLEMHDFWMRK